MVSELPVGVAAFNGRDVEGSSVAGLPLSALLSQAFVAFAADFEELGIGRLHLAATVLRVLPDGGCRSATSPMLRRRKGDGKSVLERHGYIEIMRDADKPKMRIAVPTGHGRNTRDEYEPTIRLVEDGWGPRYFADVVAGYGPSSSPSISTDRCRTR
jgi:hypothetical protein